MGFVKSLTELFSEIELEVERELDFNVKRSNIWELHQSLPDSLKRRVAHLLPTELFEGDECFEVDPTKAKHIEPDLQAEIERRLPTLDNILEERDVSVDGALELMSRAYKEVKLRSQDSGESHLRFKEAKKVNWIAGYVKKLRRHRIQWDSKLYRDNAAKDWHRKSMIENVEAMVDLSAAEFADWCNSLASCKAGDQANTVTPQLIKQLFSIDTEGSAPRGLHVEPVDVHVLPPVVLRQFDPNPSSHLEYKMKKLRRTDQRKNARPPRERAFGRSLPKELKEMQRHGLTTDMKPVFPEDLLTKEALFKGIEHLQMTRSIFDHIHEGKQFAVPDYLRKNSLFNRSRTNLDNP